MSVVIDFYISLDHRRPFDKERDAISLCFDGLHEAGFGSPELRTQWDDDYDVVNQCEQDADNDPLGYGMGIDPWEVVEEWEKRVSDLSNGALTAFTLHGDFHVCDTATYAEKYQEFAEF